MANPIFDRNLAALSTHAPELARRLATHAACPSDRFQLLQTEENIPSLAAVTPSGEPLPLHDLSKLLHVLLGKLHENVF